MLQADMHAGVDVTLRVRASTEVLTVTANVLQAETRLVVTEAAY